MEKPACVHNQQACLLRFEVQTPPTPSLWLHSSSPAHENGYYKCNLFPEECGKSNYIIIFASESLPSTAIPLLWRRVWLHLRIALLLQVERDVLHTGVSVSLRSQPALASSPLTRATILGSQAARKKLPTC